MSSFATRPVVMGTRGVVTSGHYLASAAGFRVMGKRRKCNRRGGGDVFLSQLARAPEQRNRGRGTNSHLLSRRAAFVCDQRNGVVAGTHDN